MPIEPNWKAIQRIADDRVNDMKRIFLQAVYAVRNSLDLDELAEALEQGNLGRAENAINWRKFEESFLESSREIVREIFQLAGEVTVRGVLTRGVGKREIKKDMELGLRFDLLNPRAVEFVDLFATEMIREISDRGREAVRGVIRRAIKEGGHPFDSARRIVSHIGLTDRQSMAVDNYRSNLLLLSATGKITMDVDQILARVEQYSQRMLRRRAETIARTETLRACNAGQREAWIQAADKGYLDSENMMRRWITTPDDRLCSLCMSMNGKKAPIYGMYDSSISGPPLHPNCRCAEGLVEVDSSTRRAPEEIPKVGHRTKEEYFGREMSPGIFKETDLEVIRQRIKEETGEELSLTEVKEVVGAVVDFTDGKYKEIRAFQRGEAVPSHILKEIRKKAVSVDRFIEVSPKYDGPLFRGVGFGEEFVDVFEKNLQKGARISMGGTSSFSSSQVIAESFMKANEGPYQVLYRLPETNYGASVAHLSHHFAEFEVLVHSRARFEIVNIEKKIVTEGEKMFTRYIVDIKELPTLGPSTRPWMLKGHLKREEIGKRKKKISVKVPPTVPLITRWEMDGTFEINRAVINPNKEWDKSG